MPSIAAAVAQIQAGARPVLFLDTCILLDVIPATYRCLGMGYVMRASELLGMLTSAPPLCVLVVPSMVQTEWNDNATTVRDEVRRHLEKIQDQARHFHDACNALRIPLGYGLPAYRVVNLPDHLFGLSRQLLDLAVRLDPDGGVRPEESAEWSRSCRLPSRVARSRTVSFWRRFWNSPAN